MTRSCRLSAMCLTIGLLVAFSANPAASELPSGWGVAELIEINTWGPAFDADVAVDNAGNAIAIWIQEDEGMMNVWANRYVAGVGWGTSERIEWSDSGHAWSPKVAVDSSGNAVVVWFQNDVGAQNIWTNRYVVGSGWGVAELIESDVSGIAANPQVAMDGPGNAVAVWHQDDGVRYNIIANRYAVGVGWGTPKLVETNNSGNANDPQVAVDQSGNAVAVWSHWDGSRYNIMANRYVAGSGWGTAQLIEGDDSGWAQEPQAAANNEGDVFAVWRQLDGAYNSIWANRYVVGTGWGDAELLETSDEGGAFAPDVAADGAGNAVAVWYQDSDMGYSIWANRYVAGSGWGTAELIESNDDGDARSPRVATDAAGNAVAVWYQYDGMNNNIWSSSYIVGVGWTAEELIETDNSGSAFSPSVDMNDAGTAISVWNQYSTGERNIWANRYVVQDVTPPNLSVVSPADGAVADYPVVTVSGTTEPGATVNVNGVLVGVGEDGGFAVEIALYDGNNAITITATDAAGNPSTESLIVTYVDPVPGLLDELDSTRDRLTAAESDVAKMDMWRILTIAGLIAAIVAILVALLLALSLHRDRRERRLGPPGRESPRQHPPRASAQATSAIPKAPEKPRPQQDRSGRSLEPSGTQPPHMQPQQPTAASGPATPSGPATRPPEPDRRSGSLEPSRGESPQAQAQQASVASAPAARKSSKKRPRKK